MRYNVLYDFITDNSFKNYVEIGLGKGQTIGFLLKFITDPEFKAWGVDPFECYKELQTNNAASLKFRKTMHRNQGLVDQAVNQNPRFTLIKKMSDEAAKSFEPESIDLVFIDGNHSYKYVLSDIEHWEPIVRKGGIVAGHDYVDNPRNKYYGVKLAADKYAKEHGFKLEVADNEVWYFRK